MSIEIAMVNKSSHMANNRGKEVIMMKNLVISETFRELSVDEVLEVNGGFIITGLIAGAVVGWLVASGKIAAGTAAKVATFAKIAGALGGGLTGGSFGTLLDIAARRPGHVLTSILEPIANIIP